MNAAVVNLDVRPWARCTGSRHSSSSHSAVVAAVATAATVHRDGAMAWRPPATRDRAVLYQQQEQQQLFWSCNTGHPVLASTPV